MFLCADVERGALLNPSQEAAGDGAAVKGVTLFEAESQSLDDVVNSAAKEVQRAIEAKSS